jgi:hypothetical protein
MLRRAYLGPPRVRRLRMVRLASVVGGMVALHLGGCMRHAEIIDKEDALVVAPPPELDSGIIPELDSGLGSDAFGSCSSRLVGKCEGPVDFGCTFKNWVDTTAVRCNAATGCKTTGWLEVKLDGEGCVGAIGMTQPNDAILKCLINEFITTRCSCSKLERKYFFGFTAAGDAGCGGPKGLTSPNDDSLDTVDPGGTRR